MRTSRALLLVAILLLMPLSNLSQNSLAVDSSIQVNTTWSGNVVLTGNVTVSNGSTLTLSPGTTVDGGDGYWIRVDGTLVANSAEFFFSNTTDRRLSWRWIVDRDLCCQQRACCTWTSYHQYCKNSSEG